MNYKLLGGLLKLARTNANLTQADVAKKIGVTFQNVSSWELGKSKIDIDNFAELCKLYEIDFADTLQKADAQTQKAPAETNEGEYADLINKYKAIDTRGKETVNLILNAEYKRAATRCTYDTEASEELWPDVIDLPYPELPASAGTGEYLHDNKVDILPVPSTSLTRRADCVIRVSGDSMEPNYHNGDKLLVKRQPAVDIGELGIFIINGDGYFKKRGSDRLISLNPAYDDIEIHEFDDCRTFGKVIGKLDGNDIA